jgi:hypothetical protein
MMRHLNASLAIMLAALLPGAAQGGILLFQRAINVNSSEMKFDTSHFDLDLKFDDDFFSPTSSITLFDSLVVSPADIGSTFVATAASDPNNFPAAVARITNAVNDFIKVALAEDQAVGLTEQRGWAEDFFFGHLTPPGPPDLQGDTIGRVSLRIDDFVYLTSPLGGGPALRAEGQPFDVDLTVSFFSEVPEPTAATLLFLGAIAAGALRNRCRRGAPCARAA